MSHVLLPVVDEKNLSKFGRICLEVVVVVPGPLNDVLELNLPTTAVNCWNDDIRIVCKLDEWIPRSDCFEVCSTDNEGCRTNG